MDVSKEIVPYLNITTSTGGQQPVEGAPDQDVFEQKGGTGFPTLFFLEPETGAVLNEWWWPEDEETVREMLAKASAKAELLTRLTAAAAANPDDAGAQASAKLIRAMTKLEDLAIEELEELGETEGLDPALAVEFGGWIAGKKVAAVQEKAGKEASSRDEYIEAMQEGFYALLKEGVRLPPGHDSAQMYYDLGLNGAVDHGDREVAQAAFDGYEATLEAIAESNPDVADKVAESIAAAKEKLDGIPAKGE